MGCRAPSRCSRQKFRQFSPIRGSAKGQTALGVEMTKHVIVCQDRLAERGEQRPDVTTDIGHDPDLDSTRMV